MKLITAAIWLIAAAAALYNAAMRDDIVWILIAVIFAANGIRWIVKYVRERKQSEE